VITTGALDIYPPIVRLSRLPNIIEAEGLTKTYGGKLKAVDHISFRVAEGEIFGFLGPNGAGKTTTIKMLNTLASITDGKATVAGHDVAREPGAVRKSIGVVPQELTADDELSGAENMILMGRLHQLSGSQARAKVDNLLGLVDLQDAAHRKVKTYSGGMRRRLQMVMGLLHEPKVLFLDEPTLGLDVQTRSKMWHYIKSLNKERGLTVFMTTHYLDEADSLCDRIAIIDHGTIKISGTPSELKAAHGGEIITITLPEGAEDLTPFFSRIEGVSEVTKDGAAYKIKLPNTEKALPAIVAGVLQKGVEIEGISFSKPSLDQVFLGVVGRSMRDEETGESESAWQNIRMERAR
jgi:ABC-2 type transport system ATP-binding protein